MAYSNMTHALVSEAYGLQVAPEFSPRGQKTKEFINSSFTITNTQFRYPLVMNRWANPFATIAETLWTLAGRNDLNWLERYIPQCKKWSDDGNTWRAAYGPRLRNYWGYKQHDEFESHIHRVDQIQYVISKLQEDPYSRQVVISLWDPANDIVVGSKDYPCNNWLQFLIRDNLLHMSVVLRSNDLIYGFSHNDFHLWSVLQAIVANSVGVEVGCITWFAGSLHVYERHFGLLRDMYIPEIDNVVPAFINIGLNSFTELVLELFDVEENLRSCNEFNVEFYWYLYRRSTWLAYTYAMLFAYNMKLNNVANSDIIEFLSNHVSVSTDMFEAAVMFLTHKTYNQYVNNR